MCLDFNYIDIVAVLVINISDLILKPFIVMSAYQTITDQVPWSCTKEP